MSKAPRKRRAPDTLTETGARRLAAQITSYWHERGEPSVAVWIEQFQVLCKTTGKRDHNDKRFRVLSNLVGGLPPK
jgi:hypothetical protein